MNTSAIINVNVQSNDTPQAQYKTVILKPNMVDDVNTLTQAMVNQANTKYVIKYDYVLDDDITVPANCILEFDGGSVNGEHTITGNKTSIQAEIVKLFNIDVTLAGSWNYKEAYPEWFGAKGDGSTDDIAAIQKAYDFVYTSKNQTLKFSQAYCIGSPIYVKVNSEVRFVGTERNFITAIAEMTAMITSNGDYGSPVNMCNITLNGNNLAQYGIKLQHYLTYSYIIDCGFRYFTKYAIHDIRHGCYIDKCSIYYCFNGLYMNVANGSVVRDCYFSTITNIGIVLKDCHATQIVDNILDVFGRCAILCGPSNYNVSIERNYIESFSTIGIKMKGYNDAFKGDTLYKAGIICTGAAAFINEDEDEIFLAHATPSKGISIRSNFFDYSDAQNSYMIIASSIEDSVISNNNGNLNNTNAIFGYVKDADSCKIVDTEISNNNSSVIKIKAINDYARGNGYIRNLFSNDECKSSLKDINLANSLLFYIIGSGKLVEQSEQYNGKRVFKVVDADLILTCSNKYSVGGSQYYLPNLPIFGSNDLIELKYDIKLTENSDYYSEWSNSGTFDGYIGLKVGNYITFPEVYFSGCKHLSVGQFVPVCYPFYDLIFSNAPKYLPGSFIKATKTPSIYGRYVNSDGSTTIISKGIVESKNDITIPQSYKDEFKGLWIIDSTLGKPIYYNPTNNNWIDATGTPV